MTMIIYTLLQRLNEKLDQCAGAGSRNLCNMMYY